MNIYRHFLGGENYGIDYYKILYQLYKKLGDREKPIEFLCWSQWNDNWKIREKGNVSNSRSTLNWPSQVINRHFIHVVPPITKQTSTKYSTLYYAEGICEDSWYCCSDCRWCPAPCFKICHSKEWNFESQLLFYKIIIHYILKKLKIIQFKLQYCSCRTFYVTKI